MNDRGELLMDEYEKLFNERTRIVSVTHVSNVLGTVNPVRRMIEIAHAHGVPVLVDGGAERAAFRGGRAGPRLRLFRVQRPQGLRPHGHRCALRERVMARPPAALHGAEAR